MCEPEVTMKHLLRQQRQILKANEMSMQQNGRCAFELPILEVPMFDGNILQWTEFWNLFQVAVDQNTYLSETMKMCYLKGRLTGEARDAVAGILISEENYEVVKSLLENRFYNTQVIVHHHIMDLINIIPALNNTSSLRQMYNKLEYHFRCLEALQKDTNNDMFLAIIKSKLPEDLFQQLEIQTGTKNKWSARKLRDSLNVYVCALERADHLGYTGHTEEIREKSRSFTERHHLTQTQTGFHDYVIQCRYCDGNHWSDQCAEFSTVEDRKQRIKDSCYICLKKGHIAFKCLRKKQCIYCGNSNHHHRSLCPKKFHRKRTYVCSSLDVENEKFDKNPQNNVKHLLHEKLNEIKSEMLELKTMMGDINKQLADRMTEQTLQKVTYDCDNMQTEDMVSLSKVQEDTVSNENKTEDSKSVHIIKVGKALTQQRNLQRKGDIQRQLMPEDTKVIYKYSRETLYSVRDKLHARLKENAIWNPKYQ